MSAEPALLETISHAAAQSDRWLFVALLVIGLAAIGILQVKLILRHPIDGWHWFNTEAEAREALL